MTNGADSLVANIENRLVSLNEERSIDGLPPLSRVAVKVFGQLALAMHPDTPKQLALAMTRDFDGLIEGDWTCRSVVKEAFLRQGFVYDELSGEVWIPPGSRFDLLHDSELLRVEILSPLDVLTSKAVKAKEKNRPLIQGAIAVYGNQLLDRIKEHGGDLHYLLELEEER